MPWPKNRILWIRYYRRVDDKAAGVESSPQASDVAQLFENTSAGSRIRLTDLLSRPFLVIAGPPASGKSTEVNTLSQETSSSTPTVVLSCRDFSSEPAFVNLVEGTPEWRRWKGNSDLRLRLIIDGIDEGLLRIPTFLGYLHRYLRNIPSTLLPRLQLICTCRSREWDSATGSSINNLWIPTRQSHGSDEPTEQDPPDPYRFEICPLSDEDARLAARLCNVRDVDFFFAQVAAKRIDHFLRNPYTLRMVMDEWEASGEALIATECDLYRRFARRLCEEWDRHREATLQHVPDTLEPLPCRVADAVEAVAGRLAATLIRSGKTGISLQESSVGCSDLDVHWKIIEGTREEVNNARFDVTAVLLQRTIGTGLFQPLGQHRFVFSHQTLAEFLAARYLAGLPLSSQRQLLFSADEFGSFVEPQLAEAAAWASCFNPALIAELTATDPQVLLRTDVPLTSEDIKLSVVVELLQRATSGKLSFSWRDSYRYEHLDCPALPNLLSATLRDANNGWHSRMIALQIAADCDLHSLLPEFLEILKEADEGGIHYGVAHTIARILRPEDVPEVRKLLADESNRSIGSDARIAILHGLLKVGTPIRDITPLIERAFREDSDVGFAFTVSRYLKDDDVPHLLARISAWDSTREYGMPPTFWPFVFERARTCLNERSVIDELPGALLALADLDQPVRRGEGKALIEHIHENLSLRRSMVERALALCQGQEPKRSRLYSLRILLLNNPEDFEWVFQQFLKSNDAEKLAWEELLICPHWLAPEALTQNWHVLTTARKAGFDFSSLSGFELVANAESAEKYLRFLQDRREAQEAQFPTVDQEAKKRKGDAAFREHLQSARNCFNRKEFFKAWVAAEYALATPLRGGNPGTVDWEPSRWERWGELNSETRDEIVEVAQSFLTEVSDLADWDVESTLKFDARTHAWRAINLVFRVSRMDSFASDIVANWGCALMDNGAITPDASIELLAIAFSDYRDFYLKKAKQMFAAAERWKEISSFNWLEKLGGVWDTDLDMLISDTLRNRSLPEDIARSGMRILSRTNPDSAFLIWHARAKDYLGGIIVDYQMFLTLSTWGTPCFVKRSWRDVIDFLKNPDCELIARRILMAIAYRFDDGNGEEFSHLEEDQIADLYLLLEKFFDPTDSDEKLPKGGGAVTQRREVALFRDRFLRRLVAKKSVKACENFARIEKECHPSRRSMINSLRLDTIREMRVERFDTIPPENLQSLFNENGARILRNTRDLQLIVLESLSRLNRSLKEGRFATPTNYWSYRKEGARKIQDRHKDENDISDEIVRWFQTDLKDRGLIVPRREVQAQRKTRNDIEITALPTKGEPQVVSLIIEVKGCWHDDVLTALKEQLVDDYLRQTGGRFGIYLVLFFDCPRWRDGGNRSFLSSDNIEDARHEVADLASDFDGFGGAPNVETFILDLTMD